MAQPTLETFQYAEPEEFVVRVGTGTGTVGMLHQIKSVSGTTTATKPSTSVRRIGDSNATVLRGTPEYRSTCEITWWDEPDIEDWLALSGQSSPTTGVSIDANDTVTLQVEQYVSGTLTVWHYLPSAWVSNDAFPTVDADTTPVSNSMTLESDARWVHKTAS